MRWPVEIRRRERREGRYRAGALLVIVVFSVLIALGNWQLERREWKLALIEAASLRPTLPAVQAPAPAEWAQDPAGWDYRRVRLTGRFGEGEVYSWIALADPKGDLGGPGYFVVAPLDVSDGSVVFVNRGFVPDDKRDPASRPGSAPPAGPVTVEGLLRRDDTPSMFTPDPDAESRVVFAREIATLAALLGIDPARAAPYTVDLVAAETPPGGLPQAGESLVTFSNNHLPYALTWYGTAAALVGVVATALWRRRRPPPAG